MTIFFALETTPIGLLGVLATGTSSLTRLSLDEKVNEEKAGKECSEENGEVGAELDLEGKGVGGHGLNDGYSRRRQQGGQVQLGRRSKCDRACIGAFLRGVVVVV